MHRRSVLLGLALLSAPLAGGAAQAVAKDAPATPPGPAVGDPAPDFALAGASRYGLLREHARLRDYRGQTVVLAFFFRARSRG